MQFAGSSSSQAHVEEVKDSRGKDCAGDEGEKKGGDGPDGSEGGGASQESKQKLDEKIKAEARKFLFVHHFAGPRDLLGAETHRVAKKRGFNVEAIAAEKDWGQEGRTDRWVPFRFPMHNLLMP